MTQVIGLSQGMFNLTQDAAGADRIELGRRLPIRCSTSRASLSPIHGVTMKWSELRDLIVKTSAPKCGGKVTR